LDIAVEIIITGFIIAQGLAAWLKARGRTAEERLKLLQSVNERITELTNKVAALEQGVKEREQELVILRPLAIRLPILQAQFDAMQSEFRKCLEEKTRDGLS